jgi:hypothetical protein
MLRDVLPRAKWREGGLLSMRPIEAILFPLKFDPLAGVLEIDMERLA